MAGSLVSIVTQMPDFVPGRRAVSGERRLALALAAQFGWRPGRKFPLTALRSRSVPTWASPDLVAECLGKSTIYFRDAQNAPSRLPRCSGSRRRTSAAAPWRSASCSAWA